MGFYEVLEQVLILLQRHGRVSYRALKRQFDLDDDYLDDLKAELVEIQQCARDRDGRMLVWACASTASEQDLQPVTDQESRFQALLRAVMALLQRDRRVTYRTLKWTSVSTTVVV